MVAAKFSEGSRLPWTEVFAAGQHKGKEYTPKDLDDIVGNFKRFSTGENPVLKVPGVKGHDETDLDRTDLPAGGWGESLRHVIRPCQGCAGRGSSGGERCPMCDGKGRRHVLEKRFRDLDPKFADDLRAKRFDTVSAEIYDDAKDAGLPGRGKVLRRVAFLGGEIPQVKGLKGPPSPESHAERYGGLVFSRAVKSPGGSWVCFSEVSRMADTGTKHDPHTGQFTGAGAKAAASHAAKASAGSSSGADEVSKKAGHATKTAVKSPSDESHRAAGAAHQAARRAHEEQVSRWSGRSSPGAAGQAALHKKAAEAHGKAADEHHVAAQRIKPIYPFGEGNMNRDEMIEELKKKGMSDEEVKDCPDPALAAWLRSLESAESAAAEEDDEPAATPENPDDKPPGEDDFDEPAKVKEEDDEPKVYAEDGEPVEDDPEKMSARLHKMMGKCRSFAARCGMSEEDAAKAYAEGHAGLDDSNPEQQKAAIARMRQKGELKHYGEDDDPEGKMSKTVKLSEVAGIVRREVQKALKRDVAGSIGELEKFREETLTTERKRAVEGILTRLSEQGKVPPVLRDHYADMLQNADARTAIKFSEGGKTVQLTRFEKIVRDLEKLPTLFREKAKGVKVVAGKVGDDDAEVEKVKETFQSFSERGIFPKGIKEDVLVKGFQAERKVNPELTADEFLEGLAG